jgi:uncharacterized damage-inducible protein DinB
LSKRIVLLQALAASISNLTLLLQGFDRKTLRHRPVSDAWSVADVLSHLVAVEEQYRRRLQRVLVEERPFLPRILPDETTPNLRLSVDEFAAARHETLAF